MHDFHPFAENKEPVTFFFFSFITERGSKALRCGFHGNPTVLAAVPGFPLEKKKIVGKTYSPKKGENEWK